MKLIDKNGKLFGMVNILDLTVLLIILLLILSLSVNKLFPSRIPKAIRRLPEKKEFLVKIIVDNDSKWMDKYIKIGDGQRDLDNNFITKIIKIEKSVVIDNIESLIITLNVKAEIYQGGFVSHGSNLLRIGEKFTLETKGYLLKGTVYSVDGSLN